MSAATESRTVWLLSPSVVRTARKAHSCYVCDRTIERGATYIEYLGEAADFQNGHRYHVDCARGGMLEDTQPYWHTGSCRLPWSERKTDALTCECGGERAPYEAVLLR